MSRENEPNEILVQSTNARKSGRFVLDGVWLAGILFVGSMQYWFPHVRPGVSHDSYSIESDGKKAFYLLLRQEADARGLAVSRNYRALDEQVMSTPAGQMPNRLSLREPPALCLLGPERYPNPREWDAMLRWVKAGGTLVLAARDDKPRLSIPPLSIKIRPISEFPETGGELDPSGLVRTTLVAEGNLYWESGGWIDAPKAQPLVQFAGTTQAAVQEFGFGKVIVIATDFLFSNQSLAWDDNSVLAFALIMARPTNPIQAHPPVTRIAVDESLNATGTPKIWGVLLHPRIRPLVIQALTLALVFCWWRSRRFGPLLPSAASPRRSIVDHTDALGVHAYRTKDNTGMLRAYLQQLLRELKLLGPLERGDRRVEAIAVRLGRRPESLRRFLVRAERASRSKKLKRRHAVEFIRRLALLRHAGTTRRD